MPRSPLHLFHDRAGFTLPELLLCMSIAVTTMAVAIPLTTDALDAIRTGLAARYLEGCIMDARMDAIRRSASVALRFAAIDDDYGFAKYLDGNANGVRAAEITAGIDREYEPVQLLRHHFSGVVFGLLPGLPDVDGNRGSDADGVRIGGSRLLTLTPHGTATSGTLYFHGRRAQYAVRVLGATSRTRVLQFNPGSGTWVGR